MNYHRRDFFRQASSFTAIMALRPEKLLARSFESDDVRLSLQAYKTTHIEDHWELKDIEGEIPSELRGSFYKIGPGTKDIFGQKLKHFFDGDGYVSRLCLSKDKVELTSRFIQTPQRVEEQSQGKMIFDEFGTQAPKANRKGRKNQPNINLLPWNDSILALSEGGHPAVLDQTSLEFSSFTNFKDSLPKNVSFSAHPKMDPKTGEIFAFGIEQGITKALKVYRMDPESGKCIPLYSLKQNHVYMIHDMTMTKDHLIFVIPPVYFKITDIILNRGSLAEATAYDPSLGSRLIVLDKKGKEKPIEIKFPSCLVFHHGNAVMNGSELTLDTFLSSDASLLASISDWNGPVRSNMTKPDLHQIVFDLKSKRMLKDEILAKDYDFPVFNRKFAGETTRFLYMTGMGRSEDPFAFDRIGKMDFTQNKLMTVTMPNHRTCGEPYYIPKPEAKLEDDGWLAFSGYDSDRDESFFEIREAKTLEFVARIWAGIYCPLGFHGIFTN